MKLKSAFTQNFYMDPEKVRNAGNRISTVMTGVNGCLEGASVLLGQIVSLAVGVPDGAKCGALISACDYASMAMAKSNFAEYGILVNNSMMGLADHSEAATNETIMGMEALKIRREGILNTAIGLRNLVLFKASANNKNMTFEKMRHIYTQQLETGSEDEEIELTDSYIAAKLAGVPIVNGRPYINGAYDARRYSQCLSDLKAGNYENSYIAAKLARVRVSDSGNIYINGEADAKSYNYYLNKLKETQYQEVGYATSTATLIKGYEKIRWTYVQSDSTYSIGWGCDFTKESDPDLYERYVVNREKITIEDADALFDKKIANYYSVVDGLMEEYDMSFNQNQYDALTSFVYANGQYVFTDMKYEEGIAAGGQYAERAEARKELLDYLISNNGNYDDEKIVELFVNCGGPTFNPDHQNGFANRRRSEAEYFNGGSAE